MSELQIITSKEGPIARVDFKFINTKVYNIKPLMQLPRGGLYPKGWYAKPLKSEAPWLEYRGPDQEVTPIINTYEFYLTWHEVPFVASVLE
jgi:hypothetical protein